jgi:hypothetical protein
MVVVAWCQRSFWASVVLCTLGHRFTAEKAHLFEEVDVLLPSSGVHYDTGLLLLETVQRQN